MASSPRTGRLVGNPEERAMATATLDGIQACVFDAYGTVFDVASAAARCSDVLGRRAGPVAGMGRDKQLQYSWLRGLQGRHADFWQVTGDALDYTLETVGLSDPGLRARLMDLYLTLSAFPEVSVTLRRLKDAGLATAILSNGSPRMLAAAVEAAGVGAPLDHVLSGETGGGFKPPPSGYPPAPHPLGGPPPPRA